MTDVIIFVFAFLDSEATFRLLFFQEFHIGYPVETTLILLEMPLVKKNVFVHKVVFVTIGFRKHDIISNPNMSFGPSHPVSMADIPRAELGDISDDRELLAEVGTKLDFESQFVTLIAPGGRYEAVRR